MGSRERQSRDECAAGHAHIECGICGNDAVVAAAEGDRELPQRAYVMSVMSVCHIDEGAGKGANAYPKAGWSHGHGWLPLCGVVGLRWVADVTRLCVCR